MACPPSRSAQVRPVRIPPRPQGLAGFPPQVLSDDKSTIEGNAATSHDQVTDTAAGAGLANACATIKLV
eukprot:756372-Hanusia_phi.AAC.3